MLSNPTSPIALPIAEQPAIPHTLGQRETPAASKRRVNWRWVGIVAITLGCLINSIAISRWMFAQGVALVPSVAVGVLVFLGPRLTIWIAARI